jgi:site-specific DNA recombinase
MNVVCYKRVSTDDQADRGFSLQHQEEVLRRWCEINNHNIVAMFTEDYSGKTFNRPEWNKLMEFVKKNKKDVDLILCNRWDRFSRNQYEALTVIKQLEKLGITVNTIEQSLDLSNPENKVLLNLYLTIPEVENDKNSVRTIEGSRKARLEGCWTGTAPKGYVNFRQDTRSTLKPNQDAPLIIEGFERMSTGTYSANEVRKWLNSQGLKICKQSFYNIIRNIAYIGKIKVAEWRQEPSQIVVGLHPPLVSEDVFYRANDVLDGRKRNTDFISDKTNLYPLKGFLMCPNHKTALTAYGCQGRKKKIYHYYVCTKCKKENGQRIPTEKLHKQVEDILGKIQIGKETLTLYKKTLEKLFEREDVNRKNELEKINREIQRTNERKLNLQNGYLDGHISPSDFKEMKDKIEIDLRTQQEKLNELSNGLSPYKKYITKETPMLENLVQYYRNSDGRAKKKILNCIFSERFVLEKGKITNIHFSVGVKMLFHITNTLKNNENKKELISELLSDNTLNPYNGGNRHFNWTN